MLLLPLLALLLEFVGVDDSMSNIPLYLPRGHIYGNLTVFDGILLDGLTDVYDNIHMGLCAENTASREGFNREEQDAYAIESYLLSGSILTVDIDEQRKLGMQDTSTLKSFQSL